MSLDIQRWQPPVPIAHRGSRLLWPENTMIAFQRVYDLGFRHFETDLHITSDGILVCIHDDDLDRTTSGSGPVSEVTLAELQALDAGYRHAADGGFPFRGSGVFVPTLEEVLRVFPDTSVVVDMKVDDLSRPLADLIADLGVAQRLVVGSFSDERLETFRRLTNGQVATSTGHVASRIWVLGSRVGRGGGGAADALQLPTHLRGVRVVDEKLVDVAHRAGLQVHVWTVNDRDEMVRLLDIGVDGLITDRPNLLRETLVDRGEWRDQ